MEMIANPHRLQRGRRKNNSADAAIVEFLQRARLMEATAQIVSDEGHRHVTVVRVAELAAISKKTVYALGFANADAVIEEAFAMAAKTGGPRVIAAFDRQTSWAVGFRAAVHAYFSLLGTDRRWARLWLNEAYLGVRPAQETRRHAAAAIRARLRAAGATAIGAAGALEIVDASARRAVDAAPSSDTPSASWRTEELADATVELALRALSGARGARAALEAPLRATPTLVDEPAALDPTSLVKAVDAWAAAGDGRRLWQALQSVEPSSEIYARAAAALRDASTLGVVALT